jgi:hypothetical protein
MSHYEERLEQDLDKIREHIATMADKVEEALKNAVRALQTTPSSPFICPAPAIYACCLRQSAPISKSSASVTMQ